MEAPLEQNIDISAISYNLSISIEDRLNQHQAALETVLELEKVHKKIYEKSE